MITASKAIIAFCLLAVAGTVLVIGPTELRHMLPGGAGTQVAVAAKPESKPEAKAEAKAKAEDKAEVKVEPKREAKADVKAEPKAEEPKLAAVAQPAPSAPPAVVNAPKA